VGEINGDVTQEGLTHPSKWTFFNYHLKDYLQQ